MKASLVCAALLSVFSMAASAQTFSGPQASNTSGRPSQLLSLDLNRDGFADLVALQPLSQGVAVLINNQAGGFHAPQLYLAGNGLSGLVAADFNGDGKVDLAVAGQFGVALLYGNGSGMFQSAIYYSTSGQPDSIVYGDFNNDGKKDLATLSSDTGRITILHNTGSDFAMTSFAAPATWKASSSDWLRNLAAGDVNADGRTDLAYVDRCTNPDVCGPVAIENYYVLIANGSGWNAKVVGSGSGSQMLQLLDVDNNGRADVVYSYYGCYHEPCTGIDVFYSNSNGTFQRVSVVQGFGIGGDPLAFTIGDFNNDGILDIAATVPGGTDPVSGKSIANGFAVYPGKPGGRSFSPPRYFALPAGYNVPQLIEAGFFRGTGNKDVVLNSKVSPNALLLFNLTSRAGDPCTYPTGIGLHLCSPASGATTGSSVRVRVAAHVATQPANRIELWIDGRKSFQAFNDLLDHTVTLAPGTHTLSAVSVDAAGGILRNRITIRVQ